MDCQKASTLIMEYIDGTISESDKSSLMKHLDNCNNCSEEFTLMMESIGLIEAMEDIEPLEDIEDMVMSSIDIDRYKTSAKAKGWKILIVFLTAITIIGGSIGYVAHSKIDTLKEIFVSVIIEVINFAVLKLPQILMFINDNLILVGVVVAGVLSLLFASTLTIATVELYIIKKLNVNLRRS